MQRLGWTDLAETATGRLPLVTNLASRGEGRGRAPTSCCSAWAARRSPPSCMERDHRMPARHAAASTSLDTTCPIDGHETPRANSIAPRPTSWSRASPGTTDRADVALRDLPHVDGGGARASAAGKHFIAVTDPGTPLEKMRQKEVMRVALSAPATVGGRFSALSMFGLAPAALMGIDLETLVASALEMETACHEPTEDNPAAQLARGWAMRTRPVATSSRSSVSPEYRAVRPVGRAARRRVDRQRGHRARAR